MLKNNKTNRKGWTGLVLTGAVMAAVAGGVMGLPQWGLGQTTNDVKNAKLAAHSDTAFARELLRMNQPYLLGVAATQAKGTPGEMVYKAQAIFADWSEIKKSRVKQAESSAAYVEAVTKYLELNVPGLDGGWALDEAKFVFAEISEPTLNRMEYWANNENDRKKLEPMAQLADRLLKISDVQLKVQMAAAERAVPFNDDLYMKAYNATIEGEYYRAFAGYYLAMAMEPKKPERMQLLTTAGNSLGQWADGAEDSGVKYQALLLRGKIRSEAGKTDEAGKDLAAAANEAAPEWVQYQARYQSVVAKLRGRDFKGAQEELGKFASWIDSKASTSNPAAKASAQMLGYRVAWEQADTMAAGKEQDEAKTKALAILAGIIQKEPKFRELVFDQLSTQLADAEDVSKLYPMQALALAWDRAQSVPGAEKAKTEAEVKSLRGAIAAAKVVMGHASASQNEKAEATLIAAVSYARLGELQEAVTCNLDFATMLPTDKRSKDLVDLSLAQIGELRQGQGGAAMSPEVKALTQRALDLATGKYDSKQWLFANGASLLEQGKLQEAAVVFEKIRTDDPMYLDARYKLVIISDASLGKLAEQKASTEQQKAAAKELIKQCDIYLKLLDGAPQEAKERAKAYITDMRLMQIKTSLNSLQDWDAALRSLKNLEDESKKNGIVLKPAVQGTMLRYRIQAYQMGGKADEALKLVSELPENDRVSIIRGMVARNVEEIDVVEKSEPERAKVLAGNVSDLLDLLIKSTKGDTDQGKKDIYEFRKWKGEMLARAGKGAESKALWLELQKEHPGDLINFIGEARAAFALKEYAYARNLWIPILRKLPQGSEGFWEGYLRIMQCSEALPNTDKADIKKTLKDLKVAYPNALGGQNFKKDYDLMVLKYGL